MMKILGKMHPFAADFTAELYAAVTSQSRQYIFFKDYQVPDTPQGRFEMLTLHLALMLRRLKFLWPEETKSCVNLSQNLCDWVVADIEESIRSMRVSELKITRHLKSFVEGFLWKTGCLR